MHDEVSMYNTVTISQIYDLLSDLFPKKNELIGYLQSFYKGISVKQKGRGLVLGINDLLNTLKKIANFSDKLINLSTKKKFLLATDRVIEYLRNERNICDYVLGYEIPRPNPDEWNLDDEIRKYTWEECVKVSKGIVDYRLAIYIYETEGFEDKLTASEIVKNLKSRASYHKRNWKKEIIENIIAPLLYFTGEIPGIKDLENFAKEKPKLMSNIVGFIKTRQENYRQTRNLI